MSELPTRAFKILTAAQLADWRKAGSWLGAPVDLADGHVHLSAADQVAETLAKHFAGQTNLSIAEVDLTALGDAVRWEPSRGGALFPHVYGELPWSAVVDLRKA